MWPDTFPRARGSIAQTPQAGATRRPARRQAPTPLGDSPLLPAQFPLAPPLEGHSNSASDGSLTLLLRQPCLPCNAGPGPCMLGAVSLQLGSRGLGAEPLW